MSWLADYPIAIVQAHVAELPRLRAEESIRLVQGVGVGTGSLPKEQASKIANRWSRLIAGARAIRAPRTKAMVRAACERLGMAFEEVPKR